MNQAAVIRSVARKGPCVIVGRCADYILNDDDRLIKFFIWGDIKNRIKYAKEEYGDSHAKAQENILNIDNRRRAYYSYHSGKSWGDLYNYDMSFRSDILGIDETVRLMEHIVTVREEQNKDALYEVRKEDLILNSSSLLDV